MSQIFLGTDPKSLAVDIMAKYTRSVDAELVHLTKVTPEQQAVLNLESVPIMIVTEGDKTSKCANLYSIFRHIAEVTKFESIFLGKTETHNNQVLSYFELISSLSSEELGELLNNDLKVKMFLVTHNITAADILAYAHVVHYVQGLTDADKLAKNNLFRWVDHLQHLPGISEYAETHNLIVTFPDENTKAVSKRELKKMAKKQYLQEHKNEIKEHKKDKKNKPAKPEDTPATEAKEEAKEEAKAQNEAVEEEKKTDAPSDAKPKKEKKKQNPPKPKNKPQEQLGEPITQLDIRVGKIVKVWKHPESTKLYCEQIDLGEGQPREIASGLQEFIPIEKMENAM